MKTALDKQHVKMVPDPVATRWHSWYYAVMYHCHHFTHYKEFIKQEYDLSKCPPASVCKLRDILTDANQSMSLLAEMKFIRDKCQAILYMADTFEKPIPCTKNVYDIIDS